MPVMISYSRNDWELVEPVVQFLESEGIDTWYDQKNLKPFTDWRRELLKMPRIADAFVPFISRNYIESEMCRMELLLARSFDRPVVPVMLDECWDELDAWEETTHLSRIFMARLGSLRLVGKVFSLQEQLARISRSLKAVANNDLQSNENIYISFPNGCAEFATSLHARLKGGNRRPWIATMNCEIGVDWRRAQVLAMASSKAHVLVISEDYKNQQQALRAEILTSEALELPTLCVCSPELSEDQRRAGEIYSSLMNGEQALRRLTKWQWCRDDEVEDRLIPEVDVLVSETN